MTRFERRWCRVLLDACIPGEAGLSSLDLGPFWRRFDAAAPAHLQWGLRAATWVFGLGPLLLGRRPLPQLTGPEREDCLQRMARWPAAGELVEVAKIVACFAFFADPAVQARVRGR